MYSLTDYKNRVSTKGAVTDWLTSDSANWRSLSVLLREREYRADALAVPAFPNPSIMLSLNSSFRLEYFSEGRWRKIDHTRGTGSIGAAGHAHLIRTDFRTPRVLKLLHLVVPQDTVDFVANEVQKPGTRVRSSLGDVPFFDDPVITNFGFSAISGAPRRSAGFLRSGCCAVACCASSSWRIRRFRVAPVVRKGAYI
jgi:hypothetical protein